MQTKRVWLGNQQKWKNLLPLVLLFSFGIYFTFDLFSLKLFLNHPEYVHYYHAFRYWFLQRLLNGEFPQWNPYWGVGDTAQIETSFPVDIFSPLEILFGPLYHRFYPVQMVVLLFGGYWSLRKLNFSKSVAAFLPGLFVLAPWVSYFFLYQIKTISFLALAVGFTLSLVWFRSHSGKALYLFLLVMILSLFGTKLEYWFFQTVYFAAFGFFAYRLWSKGNRRALYLYWAVIVLAVLVHTWQINPLLQILSQTSRLENPPGLRSLVSSEFYQKLFLSVRTSIFIPTLISAFTLYWAFTQPMRRRFLGVWAAAVLIFALKLPSYPGWTFLAGPFGIGALVGLASFAARERKLLPVVRALALFFPLALYWCRKEPGDLHEVTVLHGVSTFHQALAGCLLFWGVTQWETRKPAKLCYLLLIALFFLRDQGQILLAFFKGFMWIPTRDSHLFEWTLVVLFGFGIRSIAKKLSGVLVALASVILLWSITPHFYYSHPLVSKVPEGYPTYLGSPQIRKLFASVPSYPPPRIYFHDRQTVRDLSTLGASLWEAKPQVLDFSSLLPRRYRDFNVFHWYGIRPEQKWGGYEAEYTAETIAKLPARNTLNFHNDTLYLNTLYAFPPANPDTLRLLGVTHVVQANPALMLPGLKNFRFYPQYTVAEFSDPLPRVFSYPVVSVAKQKEIAEEVSAQYGNGHLIASNFNLAITPQKIAEFSREKIRMEVNLKQKSTVVLTELFHPFWKAKLDGMRVEIQPALHLYRAVEIPAGKHVLEFECEIPFLWWGGYFSMGLLALILMFPIAYPLYQNARFLNRRVTTAEA